MLARSRARCARLIGALLCFCVTAIAGLCASRYASYDLEPVVAPRGDSARCGIARFAFARAKRLASVERAGDADEESRDLKRSRVSSKIGAPPYFAQLVAANLCWPASAGPAPRHRLGSAHRGFLAGLLLFAGSTRKKRCAAVAFPLPNVAPRAYFWHREQ